MRSLLSIALMCLVSTACGGSSASPAAPTPATPTVSALAITGNPAIRTGFFATYTATATLSNGITQDVTSQASWTSSNPGVATASTTTPGRVDANTNGTISLTATYQGRSASIGVNSVNNYGGQWSGTYLVRVCDNSGIFAISPRWCASFGPGVIAPFSLSLDQSSSPARTQITGTMALGTLSGNITGNVTGDGRLNIGGTYAVVSGGTAFTITIGGWNSTLTSGGGMSGQWAQNLAAINIAGNAYNENVIASATHTSLQDIHPSAPLQHIFASPEALFYAMK